MFTIWANFFSSPRRVAVYGLVVLLCVPRLYSMLHDPIYAFPELHSFRSWLIGLWVFAVIFVVPAAIFAIDYRHKNRKRRD